MYIYIYMYIYTYIYIYIVRRLLLLIIYTIWRRHYSFNEIVEWAGDHDWEVNWWFSTYWFMFECKKETVLRFNPSEDDLVSNFNWNVQSVRERIGRRQISQVSWETIVYILFITINYKISQAKTISVDSISQV